MTIVEVPMYRENNSRVQLVDLLGRISANDWTWSILEFEGVGQIPFNTSYPEFQEMMRERPHGIILNWDEISRFAKTIEYTIDCLIVAVLGVEQIDGPKLFSDDFQGCEIVMRAIDSTEWILFAADQKILDGMEEAAHGRPVRKRPALAPRPQ